MNLFLLFASFLLFTACNSSGGGQNTGTTQNPVTETVPPTTTPTPIPKSFPVLNDPLAEFAWHLNNTGQNGFSTGAGIANEDFNIQEVHSTGIKGYGVKIAVSDTGTETTHPDLSANEIPGEHRNYSSSIPSQWRNTASFETDIEAHGTAVTGLIAATEGNGIGSKGVAPEAKYGAFYFIGDFSDTNSSAEAKMLDQMTGLFDIYNYSYGYPGCQFVPAWDSVIAAYRSGVTSLRAGKGAIYVKAAGNDYIGTNSKCDSSDDSPYLGNTNTDEEQNHPYLILVGAMNAHGKISSYSTPGSGLWISSAGGEFGDDAPAMLTTDITGCSAGYSDVNSKVPGFNAGSPENASCDYTSTMNGTSSATPVLSGIVALMLHARPSLNWREVKHILAMTAEKVNFSTAALPHPAGDTAALPGHVYDYNYVTNAAGISFSNTYGFGRVDANAAVNLAKTFTGLRSFLESPWTSSANNLNIAIPDKNAAGVTSSLNVSSNFLIEAVEIKVTINHSYIGDLGVELTSPSGTKSKLLLINSNIKQVNLSDYTLLTNAFYGERSRGSWAIKVIDGADADVGTLVSWKIKVNGRSN